MTQTVVIDLDRTLLHTDKTISEFSIQTLSLCKKKDIKVVLATARPVRTVVEYITRIACDAVIYHNGAFTHANGKPAGKSFLVPINEARRILESLQNRYKDKKLSIEINDTLYANFDVKEFWSNTNGVETDFTDLPDADADKIIIEITTHQEYQAVLSMLPPSLYGEMSDGKLCLVMNKGATKLNAVRELSALWNIPLSDVAAFGDDFNDIGMIRHCGVGVAMGNAIPEVIAAADAVTDSNDEDGVANYIVKYII